MKKNIAKSPTLKQLARRAFVKELRKELKDLEADHFNPKNKYGWDIDVRYYISQALLDALGIDWLLEVSKAVKNSKRMTLGHELIKFKNKKEVIYRLRAKK